MVINHCALIAKMTLKSLITICLQLLSPIGLLSSKTFYITPHIIFMQELTLKVASTLNISMHHLHTYKFALMESHHRGEKLNLGKQCMVGFINTVE